MPDSMITVRDEIEIRRALPTDYGTVVAVMDEWWGRPISEILPRLFLDHFSGTSLVAENGDRMAGFLVGFHSAAHADEAYIHAVAVAPTQRGTGLGRQLYETFFAECGAAGRTVIRAVTSPVNTQSIAFHRSMGFAVGDPVSDYDGPGLDRVCFRLNLTERER
jgi:ribosomal protein S18 acetylase RimI-like enzyme